MILRDRIEEMVQNFISDEYFIVDVSVSGPGHHQKITVLLDGDDGIKIDKCVSVSRALGDELEKCDMIDQKYVLEVSSPGIDYPLKFERQYKKNIGRRLKIQLQDDSIHEGVLVEVKENVIVIDKEVVGKSSSGKVLKSKKTFQETEIAFNSIKKTNVVISFS